VFDYLAGEIFEQFEPQTRAFLLRVACLPRMTGDVARELSGEPNAGRLLVNLALNNYFVSEAPSEEGRIYQLHPLLLDFLRGRAARDLPEALAPAHLQRAAALLRGAGATGLGVRVAGRGHSHTPLVATDGHRLALGQATLDAEIPKQEVILPRKTVLELQRLLKDEDTPIEMRFAGNQARFNFSGMEFVTKLVEGKFPDYNRVIPKNHKNAVVMGRAPLLASLQRAAILTSEKFKGVRVNIEPGSLRIASSNADQEEAKEELEIDYNGDAIEIGFNVTYLMDALANMNSEMVKLELQDTAASALFTVPDQPGFKYVVMPMRI